MSSPHPAPSGSYHSIRAHGAPPVELVDGEKLAGMLEKLELGLKPRHTFDLDATFFDEYRK